MKCSDHAHAARKPRARSSSLLLVTACVALAGCTSDDTPSMHVALDPQSTFDAGQVGTTYDAGQSDTGSATPAPGSSGTGNTTSDGGSTTTGDAGKVDAAGVAASDAGPASLPDGSGAQDAVPSADSGLDAEVPGSPSTIADFAKPGPYAMAKRLLDQGVGTVSGGTQGLLGATQNNPSGFTLWYPQNVKSGERFPLLTWGNGTFCAPTFYDELMNFVVSYGYVVIASNTADAGTGAEMLKAVDWALAENEKAGSPLHGLIDVEHIGAFGHSQGGEGAVNTGSDPRIDAIAPLSAGPMGSGEAKIRCPAFYALTANDVVTPEQYRPSYEATTTPSVLGVTSKGDHDEYSDKADDPGIPSLSSNDALFTRPAIVAWFEWQLKGKSALKALFIGKDCGFCRDPNWKTFESKGF